MGNCLGNRLRYQVWITFKNCSRHVSSFIHPLCVSQYKKTFNKGTIITIRFFNEDQNRWNIFD